MPLIAQQNCHSWAPSLSPQRPTLDLRYSLFYFSGISLKVVKAQVLVAQSCPTLWDPKDYSLPDSSVHRVFWARILEWVAISFSGGSFQPRGWTCVSRISGRFFPSEPPGKPLCFLISSHKLCAGFLDQVHLADSPIIPSGFPSFIFLICCFLSTTSPLFIPLHFFHIPCMHFMYKYK